MILDVEAGVAAVAVDLLEAVRTPVVGLEHQADAVARGEARIRVQAAVGVAAAFDQEAAVHVARDRRGDHVQGAANGVRPLGDRGRAFQYLEGVHAASGREVIGGWRGVGCRRDQHAILHQCDAATALGGRAADAEVGTQPVAVLELYRDTRDFADDVLDVGVVELQ